MLNIPLYNSLVKIFKEVKVSNEDEQAVYRAPKLTRQQNLLRNRNVNRRDLMPERMFGGEQYYVCCPFCGDKRYRLYISHTWDKWLVTESGERFHAGKMGVCQNEDCLKCRSNFMGLEESIRVNTVLGDDKSLKCSTNASEFQHRTVALPPLISVNDAAVPLSVRSYVTDRGYDPDELADVWHVGVADIWFYPKPALIFPIIQNGVHKCWQARYASEDFKDIGKPKYFWPSGVRKTWLLYNMDMAKLYPAVVVTEGVLDAVRVGAPAVCLFGKVPSNTQAALLATHWKNGSLVWIPDENDPFSVKAAEEYTKEWNIRGVFKDGAHVVRLEQGDPGDHTREELWRLILKHAPALSRFAEKPIL